MPSARQAALQALMHHRKSGTPAEAVLDKEITKQNLSPRDAALASKLTFGVLQNRTLLDFYLSKFSHTPTEKLEPRILDILRIAAYQILFLDRIPDSAAVDEAVEQTKQGSPKAAGLVNAILRRLTENKTKLPAPPDLATKYSHPNWLVRRLTDELGEESAEALLAANNAEVPLYAQVNTLKTTLAELAAAMAAEGVTTEPHPWLPDCLILKNPGNPAKLQAFRDGMFYIQDPAARLAVLAADLQSDTRILDACAAPGGKSFAAAIQIGNKGEIISSDLQEKKLAKIQTAANHLGITILHTRAMDARTLDPTDIGAFDTVIVDAPCSGLGIIRKKPEIRDKTPEEIARLPEIQLEILQGAAKCVALGGVLLYATCTILPEENSGVIAAFLKDNANFIPESINVGAAIGRPFPPTLHHTSDSGRPMAAPTPNPIGQITLYPHIHGTDGFFFCKLRRVN
ncbi:MAG: 16S rRNA (cytosine(967)-C(5))-methyltransferase RsmB [Oscillospiraceae bacterium]|nr:16S rRNA (cytosine(967)-C(5))-methyltransferase RsmB [Oscillospiraceae bacterium]